MKKIIDLRSDTITQPSPQMRQAMGDALIGDDLHGEDTTTRRLEEMSAELLGKPAALFVVSGTMANLVAFLVLCRPGSEVILDENAYTYWSEAGSWARFGGIQARLLPSIDGLPSLDVIRKAIRSSDLFEPPTGLVCLENPHNWAGGVIISPEATARVADLVHQAGIPLYVDGARIFNAAVAWARPVADFAAPADALMFCLMKGLCCPAGAVLVGDREFIEKARSVRQSLGGGMAMPGVLAAAGIVALEQMVDRLAQDHENARILAEGIDRLASPLVVDLRKVQTNMVFVDVRNYSPGRETFLARLEEHGVLAWGILDRWVRFVTHFGIDKADVQDTIRIIGDILEVKV